MGKIRQLYQKACLWLDDNFVYILLAVLLICGVVCAWLLYTECRTDNEYNDVNESVQSIESDNQQTGREIESASVEIEHAQKELSHGIERTDRIAGTVNEVKRRTDSDTKIINDCNNIIEAGRGDASEARAIFADVEKSNQESEAQTGSNS